MTCERCKKLRTQLERMKEDRDVAKIDLREAKWVIKKDVSAHRHNLDVLFKVIEDRDAARQELKRLNIEQMRAEIEHLKRDRHEWKCKLATIIRLVKR